MKVTERAVEEPSQIVLVPEMTAVGIGYTVANTVAVPGFGQAPDPGLVVMVNRTSPSGMDGVYVAVTVMGSIPDVIILLKAPVGADHVADDAAPVNVPVTIMDSPAQSD